MTFASTLNILPDGNDCVPAFEAAIANPAVTSIEFEPGLYRFGSQVELKSNIAIRGCGRATRFAPLSSFSFGGQAHLNNAVITTQPNSVNVIIEDLMMEGLGIYAGTPGPTTRICAIVMRRTTGFRVRRVVVRDWTGYAFWASGDDPVDDDRVCSGAFEDCFAENCNILYEQNLCRGINLRRCHGSDGKRTIAMDAAFHPWFGAEKVTYEDCTYIGAAGGGISIVTVGQKPIKEIVFRRCRISMEAATTAIVAGWQTAADKPYRIELTVEDCDISSPLYNCASLYNVDAIFRQCNMSGFSISAVLNDTSVVLFEDTELLASNDPNGGATAHALRLEAGSNGTTKRGALRARGKNPIPYIGNPALLDLDPETILEPAP